MNATFRSRRCRGAFVRWLTGAVLFIMAATAVRPALAQEPEARTLSGHRAAVVSIAFSEDGKALTSCDSGGVLKLWDVARGIPTQSKSGGTQLTSLAFRGGTLAVGGNERNPETGLPNGTVAAVKEGRDPVVFGSVQSNVTCVALAEGRLAAGGANRDAESGIEYGVVRLWGERKLDPERELPGRSGERFHSVAFTHDGQWLAAGSGGHEDGNLGRVTLWNLINYESKAIRDLRGVVYSVAFSKNALAYAGVTISGGRKVGFVTVRVFGTEKEETRQGPTWLNAPVRCVVFSPDGEGIAVGTGAAVLLWKHNAEQPFRLPTQGNVLSVAISPDGNAMAAGCSDGTITLWTPGSEKPAPLTDRALPLVLSIVSSVDGTTVRDAKVSGNGVTWVGYGQDGTYRLSVPAPARYPVIVSKEGYAGQTLSVDVGDQGGSETIRLQPAAPARQPRSLILVVEGADDQPIPAPTIAVSGGATLKGAGQDGTYTYILPDDGAYNITVDKEGYKRATRKVEIGERDLNVVVRLERDAPTPKPLTLQLSVVEAADGERNLNDATVRVARDTASPVKGADGVYLCSVPQAGTYQVSVQKDGYVPKALSVRVASDGQREIVQMVRGLALTVVDDEINAPVPDCTISIPKAQQEQADPLRDGNIYRYALTPGTHDVSVSREGYSPKTVSIVVETGGTSAQVRLRRALFNLTARVHDAAKRPVAGLDVVAPPGRKATEPEPGNYALRLAPGTYEVKATRGADVFPAQRVIVASADAAVDLTQGPGAAADPQVAVNLLFRRFDTDCNLRVNAADFSPKVWKDLSNYDTDANGELDRKELGALVKAPAPSATPPWFSMATDPLPHGPKALGVDLVPGLQRRLDTNGDGRVDQTDCDITTWNRIKTCDRNGDGVLDRDECAALFQAPARTFDLTGILPAGKPDAGARLDELVRRLDRDANGRVEEADFTDSAWPQIRAFDRDGNGVLTRVELRPLLDPSPAKNLETPDVIGGVLTIRKVAND